MSKNEKETENSKAFAALTLSSLIHLAIVPWIIAMCAEDVPDKYSSAAAIAAVGFFCLTILILSAFIFSWLDK